MERGKEQKRPREETIVVLRAAEHRWARNFSANHIQTTFLPSSHCTFREALFHPGVPPRSRSPWSVSTSSCKLPGC